MQRTTCFLGWMVATLAGCGAASTDGPTTPVTPETTQVVASKNDHYRAIIEPERLKAFMTDPKVVLVDVRPSEEYAKGHITGAINMPADVWRTPSQKAGKPSHDLFMTAEGVLDVAKYEALLGGAGIAPDSKVVVYGNHGGKADGSVPAMVLLALGHNEVGFVDGVAFDRWKAAGNSPSVEAKKLAPTTYKARVATNFVWTAEQVKQHLNRKDVVFVDARGAAEYSGADARDNKRAGHVPGAVNLNYEELLTKDKRTIPPSEARALLQARGITQDKKVVVYCQTGTRAAHNVMVMRELGYTNVAVYDGSWQEWGNRDDTPVETAPQATHK